MKIGIGQINPTVGDLRGNAVLIRSSYEKLVRDGADLVVFPEMALTGYPPRDLLFKSRFVSDTEHELAELASHVSHVPALIGFAERNGTNGGRPFYNSAAWCLGGEIATVCRKCLLPAYDVFDEERYFEPAREPRIIEWQGLRIGVTICEDLWNHPAIPTRRHYSSDPVACLADAGIDLLLNISASPWYSGKTELRDALLADAAKRVQCPLVYCNLVGGNDELIFDGHSRLINADGTIATDFDGFCEVIETVVCPDGKPDRAAPPSVKRGRSTKSSGQAKDPAVNLHRALVLGLHDYAVKSGFNKVIIGLSGGIDSAVTAALAVDALGADKVLGVSLPSAISSNHSRDDAEALAHNLGIRYEVLPIAPMVEAAEASLQSIFAEQPRDVTEENIQARVRGLLLMALSNKFHALLLTTGNKSEVAVGYCTLYGDMAGGLAVLSDVSKMQVYALANYLNRATERIPQNTIDKAPSAELRPDQKDEDSLPPYPVLDEILRLYVEEGRSSREITACGFAADTVAAIIRKVDLNEYKRKQAAPGLKVTPLAFGVGRRIPIVQKYIS